MREHSNDKINSKKILLKQTKQKKEKEEIWNEIKEIRETLRIKLKGVKKNVEKNTFKGKKIKKFNLGLKKDELKIYKKRVRVEHFFSFLKGKRLRNVINKNKKMIYESIYSRIIDLVIINKIGRAHV